MLKVAGPIIKANFPNVKLFMAEDLLRANPAYEKAIAIDPCALACADIWAYHGSDQTNWTSTYSQLSSYGRLF